MSTAEGSVAHEQAGARQRAVPHEAADGSLGSAVIPAGHATATEVGRVSEVGDLLLAAEEDPTRPPAVIDPDDIVATVLGWYHIPYRRADRAE